MHLKALGHIDTDPFPFGTLPAAIGQTFIPVERLLGKLCSRLCTRRPTVPRWDRASKQPE